MAGIKWNLGTLALAGFSALFVWVFEHWLDQGATPAVLPLQSKMAFAAALPLMGGKLFLVLGFLRTKSRQDWLQRAAIYGVYWFIWMCLVTDVAVPGADAGTHFIGAMIFGLFMGYLPPRSEFIDASTLNSHRPLHTFGLVLATVALSLLPFTDQPGLVFFFMILAVLVAAPGGKSWGDIKWHDWAILLLGTAMNLAGLFISIGAIAPIS